MISKSVLKIKSLFGSLVFCIELKITILKKKQKMEKTKNHIILDKEKSKILENIKNKKLIDAPLSKEEKEKLSSYAKYTKSLKKSKTS